jgi:NAD(P)-dependent dehydrogenase (short-subunit alcohol dehydrogenase family)
MSGKIIVISGASSGIGRACALRLASRGFTVFAGVRAEKAAEELKRNARGSLTPVFLDVTDGDSIRLAVDVVKREAGEAGLQGVVNNAGISVAGPLEILPLDALRRQFEVNVIGQIALTRAFLPLLRTGKGRIILMGSILGRLTLPFLGAYAGAKFALEAVAETLGMELRQWGIPVTIIEPGNVSTPIWEKSKSLAQGTAWENGEQGWGMYGRDADAFMRYTARTAAGGIPAERVARTVERALRSARPRARYTVGWDSRLFGGIAPLLPGRFRQWIIRRVAFPR